MHTPWRLRGLRCAVQTYLCRIWLHCYRKRNHVGPVERCLSRSASIPNFAQGLRVCCAYISGDERPGENLFPSWGWRDSPYARDGLGRRKYNVDRTHAYLSKSNREIKLWESSTKTFGVIIFYGTKSLGGRSLSTFTAHIEKSTDFAATTCLKTTIMLTRDRRSKTSSYDVR